MKIESQESENLGPLDEMTLPELLKLEQDLEKWSRPEPLKAPAFKYKAKKWRGTNQKNTNPFRGFLAISTFYAFVIGIPIAGYGINKGVQELDRRIHPVTTPVVDNRQQVQNPELSIPYNDLIYETIFNIPPPVNEIPKERFTLSNRNHYIVFQQGLLANYVDGLEVKVDDWGIINLSRDPRVGINARPYEAAVIFLMETDRSAPNVQAANRFAGEEFDRLHLSDQLTGNNFGFYRSMSQGALPVYEAISSTVYRNKSLNKEVLSPDDFSYDLSLAWVQKARELLGRPSSPDISLNSNIQQLIKQNPPLRVTSISNDLIQRATQPRG